VILGLDLSSWYGVVAVLVAAFLFWLSVAEIGHRLYRAIKRRLWPERPETLLVLLRDRSYAHSTETI
jgi:hypothetical protein